MEKIEKELEIFINSKSFSCIGAKTALKKKSIISQDYYNLSDLSIKRLYQDLENFVDSNGNFTEMVSFIAIFSKENFATENEFEDFLWKTLHYLNEIDKDNYCWAENYSKQSLSKEFSFSIANQAFFIVGLHPMSSRISRRFKYTALVFNSHKLFEHLKSTHQFYKIQTGTRKNELRIQNNLNPHLSEFGDESEAAQYASNSNMVFDFSKVNFK